MKQKMNENRPRGQEKGWLLDADEACRVLGDSITKRMLYRWCEQDLIPHIHIGRRLFFSRLELEKWRESYGHGNGGSP